MLERPKKKPVSIALPADVYDRLKILANEDNRTLSGEIRQILKGYLEYTDRGGVSWCRHWYDRGIEQYESHSPDTPAHII